MNTLKHACTFLVVFASMSIQHMKNSCILAGSMLFLSSVLFAQGRNVGTVSGVVKEDSMY